MGITLAFFSVALMVLGIYLRISGENRLIKAVFGIGFIGSLFFVLIWLSAAFEVENSAYRDGVATVIHTMEAIGGFSTILMLCGVYLRISDKIKLANILFYIGFVGILLSGSVWTDFMRKPLSSPSSIIEE